MTQLLPPSLRSASAVGLLLGLAIGADLVLTASSRAGQVAASPCSKLVAVVPVAAASQAASPMNGSLLAQALPSNQSQPVGAELGEPACTYDPVVPPKRQIIRGLW